jgi:hypothetical protein
MEYLEYQAPPGKHAADGVGSPFSGEMVEKRIVY